MIKEVAIEPEVMADWQHFRELWDDLGVRRGRLAAEYPSNWRDVVIALASQKHPVKAGKIIACLKPNPGSGQPKRTVPTTRSYPKNDFNTLRNWLQHAENNIQPKKFDAIIAAANPRFTSNVLVAGEYLKSHQTWSVESHLEIPRTASSLLRCAEFLLRVSDELILVEPNFDATEPGFVRPLEMLANCRSKSEPWKRLELHTKYPLDGHGKLCPEALPNRMKQMRSLAKSIPKGSTLGVFFWQRKPNGKRIHPRYILTEIGGLQPDYGLGEGDCSADTTTVALLADSTWETVRQDHHASSKAFLGDPSWRCVIQGAKE